MNEGDMENPIEKNYRMKFNKANNRQIKCFSTVFSSEYLYLKFLESIENKSGGIFRNSRNFTSSSRLFSKIKR